MKIHFQADADFNQIIIKAMLRREPSIDIQTALSANLQGLSDIEVLNLASKDNRVLLTHDRKTMPKHFASFITGETSSGVLIIPQKLPISQVVEELILIWSVTEAEEWINRIYSLTI